MKNMRKTTKKTTKRLHTEPAVLPQLKHTRRKTISYLLVFSFALLISLFSYSHIFVMSEQCLTVEHAEIAATCTSTQDQYNHLANQSLIAFIIIVLAVIINTSVVARLALNNRALKHLDTEEIPAFIITTTRRLTIKLLVSLGLVVILGLVSAVSFYGFNDKAFGGVSFITTQLCGLCILVFFVYLPAFLTFRKTAKIARPVKAVKTTKP
jgi:hypothetical protein